MLIVLQAVSVVLISKPKGGIFYGGCMSPQRGTLRIFYRFFVLHILQEHRALASGG